MAYLVYLPIVLMGYLLGTSNMAVYLAALKGDDLRAHGSGNPGASNAMLLWGWKAGVIVGIHDIGKAMLAVYLAERLFPDVAFAGVAAGVACVIGHMFPFYLRFHGGKGFASYLGMTLALNWKFALGLCIAILIITLVTDYIVL
ncbi:MAG: glycerol-3-phosphate acyltransferase, partial [Oscillospiraceae bacterium]|nr:glycerol-3-phosphate acyltransferase [Oscillospiraceae bacterium]